jgi:hypothetical protein
MLHKQSIYTQLIHFLPRPAEYAQPKRRIRQVAEENEKAECGIGPKF